MVPLVIQAAQIMFCIAYQAHSQRRKKSFKYFFSIPFTPVLCSWCTRLMYTWKNKNQKSPVQVPPIFLSISLYWDNWNKIWFLFPKLTLSVTLYLFFPIANSCLPYICPIALSSLGLGFVMTFLPKTCAWAKAEALPLCGWWWWWDTIIQSPKAPPPLNGCSRAYCPVLPSFVQS